MDVRESVTEPFFGIVNEAAGGGRCKKTAPEALAELERRQVPVERVFTERSGHATELAREAALGGHRRFISFGGDGTAAEIVNGLVASGASPECELAMMPLGTGNSFLRDFDITSPTESAEAIATGRQRPLDVLQLTHEAGVLHFINTMGTGFVARAGKMRNERFSYLGTAGYVAAVLVCVATLRYERSKLRYSERLDEGRTVLTAISNSQYTGGTMWMAPDADVSDGLLDVVRAGPLSRSALLSAFKRIFEGTHTQLDEVWTAQVSRVEFIDPVSQPVLVDGDLFHLKPLAVDVLPHALRLIA